VSRFRKLSQPSRKGGLARIHYDSGKAACSCGWGATALRSKVLEDKIDRHIDRKHNGMGIRL
jgi:hypothetical protein